MSTNDFWSLVEKEKKKKAGFNSGLNIDTTPNGAFGDLVQQYKFKSSPFAYTTEDDDDFAPIKTTVSGKGDEDDGFSIGGIDLSGWFQKGALEDGYDFGDVTKVILGTAEDAVGDLTAGILGMPEKAIDAVATGHSIWTDIVGLDGVSKKLSNFVARDLYDENAIAKGMVNASLMPNVLKWMGAEDEEAVSVLGEKTDSTVQSGGQMLATAALQAAGVPWQVTTAVMSYGTEAEQAFREGATPLEAGISSAVSAGSEVLFESLSGGISFGGKTMDDAITKLIARTVSNKAVRTLLKLGVDFTGEGIEEILTGFFSSIGQKLTYAKEKDWAELFSIQEVFDSFVSGAFMGGFSSGVNAVKGKVTGVDPVSGLVADEEAVVKKVYDNMVAQREADGKKLTEREKTKLYDSILTQIEKGYIKADTIESILGGESYDAFKSEIDTFFGSDTYKAYDSARKGEESLPELQKKYEELYKMPIGEKSDEQVDQQAELKKQIEAIQNSPKSADLRTQLDTEAVRIRELQSKLRNEVYSRVKGTRLAESYRELERSKQKFTADPSKYENEYARKTVQSIVDSGLGDNTNQFHDTVEFLARMSADKGVVFNLTDTEGVKKDGHYKEGYVTNGYVTGDGKITINKDSSNALHTIVGHEITHVLEKAIAKDGSEGSYSKLQQAIFEYAKTKEGLEKFNARLEAAREAYAGKDNTSAEAEVAADLVGEYLFTDYEFISNLSKTDRNVFQRIWDEVKYMAKIAVAGSKEAREFEKAKKMFQKAYNENVKGKAEAEIENQEEFDNDDVQYSISVKDKETLDFLDEQVSRGEYDAETNPDGGYYVTYKSMSFWGYDEDGNAILRSPMAEYVDGELSNAYLIPKDKSKLNWYQSTETIDENTGLPTGLLVKTKKPGNKSYSFVPASENQDLIAEDWSNLYFNLKKKVMKNGKWVDSDVPARYNPYEHSSNSMLNDQFSTAYLRDNLVTVKMYVPVSEDNGTYRAKWSKDPTGWADWKSGTVAGKINQQKDLQRRVYLSRYAAPVEIVSDSEVAQAYKGYIEGTDVSIPDNVVSPGLLNELRKAGVPVRESGKVKYSLTKDSDGKQLTKAQQDFFKDSKIVDEKGNLKIMYHGSPETFTVFDKKKAKSSGYYGKGFYFTDSESHAGQYGNKYEVYLNITNPLQDGTSNITKEQLRKFIEAIADNEDYGIDNYGYDATIDSVTDAVYGKSDFAMLMDINASCVGNMVEAVELFNEVNGTDYNGIIAPTETVAFYPNQIKRVGNSSPTADPDIRFSMSKPVEETRDLMALHNLKAEELLKSLDLGGFPMPSIAVIKAEAGHEQYGDISLVFPKDVIDPKKDKANKVYGGDAWTPTYPRMEYKPSEAVAKKIRDKYRELHERFGYDDARPMYDYQYDMEKVLNRSHGEANLLEELYNDTDLMQLYLQDTGKGKVDPVVIETETRMSDVEIEMSQYVINALGEDVIAGFKKPEGSLFGTAHHKQFMEEHDAEIREAYKQYFIDAHQFTEEQAANVVNNTSQGQLLKYIRNAYNYLQNNGVTINTKTDHEATWQAIRDASQDGYREWVDSLFKGIEEKTGIRNNADYYTRSGNPRSWEALHWENTLENVVKAMKQQDQTGSEAIFGVHKFFAAASKDYRSIAEVKADADRLHKIDDGEYKAAKESYEKRLSDIATRIADKNASNQFIAMDNAMECIVDAVRKSKTKAAIYRELSQYDQLNVTESDVDDIISLVNDIGNMPTGYFEAKPQRAVSFEEVGVFVIPRNADIKLKQALLSRGYNIAEYNPDVEGDRTTVVNNLDEYKFSLTPEGVEPNTYGDYHYYGRDIGYNNPLDEFIPTREDIAPAPAVAPETVSKTETVDDMFPDDLPSIDEELDTLLQQKEALESRMREALNAEDYDAFAVVNDEYNSLMARLEELEQEASNMDEDRLSSIDDAEAPPVRENEWLDRADVVPLTKKAAQDIARDVRQRLALSNKQMYDVHMLIEEYSRSEFPDREQLFRDIKEKFGTYTESEFDETVKEAKSYLRTYGLFVSDSIKKEIADYAHLMRKNRGRIRFSKEGTEVDVLYHELNSLFPHLFPESIIAPTDQFLQMVDVANMDAESKVEQDLPDDAIWDVADAIADSVTRYQQTQKEKDANKYGRESFNSLMRDADQYAPFVGDDIAPDVVAEPTEAEIAPAMENDIPAQNIAPSEATEPTTANERLAKKIENYENELAKNQQLREQSAIDYDNEIARLQAEYDAKKNKRSLSAHDLLRRIERVKRMKNNVDADYAKRISDLGARIEKLSTKDAKTAAQRQTKMEQHTEKWKNMIGDTSTWKDMALGLSYKTKTLRRILRKVVRGADGKADIALADRIYDELETKYDHNEALLKRESQKVKAVFEKLNLNHAEDTYAHMLGELRHNPETTLTPDVVNDYYNKHKSRINSVKVERAIAEARSTFDSLLVRVNNALREQGFKEIPYRKGYFPHFTNPKQGWLAKLLNWKTIDTEVPTSIAGLTETFTPQRSWQSFNKERKGDATDYSLYQGLDTYIHGALDWIYHIDDLQSRRALENHIRYVHSEEGVKARIDEIKANEEYDADEAQVLIDGVLKEAENPLSGLVRELMNRTNTLANKKSSMDRGMEDATNRKVYSVMTNLNNRINANMVVGSFSSALTNFIPMVQSWHQVSPYFTVRGLGDMIRSTVRDDGMIAKSDFLTNRLIEEEKLYQTGWDKVTDKAALMMNVIDNITSQTVWRSKYLQNIKEGMSESQAIKDADQFAKNLIAGRSRGNAPTIFDAKNPLVKIATAFQLEVANQYGYMFEDVPQDSKNKARLVKGYATAFVGSYLYNALYSSLVGRDAAFDPISIFEDLFKDLGFGDDDEEEPEDIVLNLVDNILDEVPYVGGLVGGGRIPISSALPYEGDYKSFIEDAFNGEVKAKEMLKPLYYLAMPVGGGQIKKTVEGLSMFDDDLPVAGSYTDSGALRFPVEDTLGNRIQAGMFGQYASQNAREYFDKGYAPMQEKQIQEYIDVDIPIRDYWEYREGLKGLDKAQEKVDYIYGLDLPIGKKNILVNNQLNRKEKVDLTEYGEYDNLEEFDFAKDNPEKYDFFTSIGVTYRDYKNADEKGKGVYNWAFENPEKYTVSKAVTGDLFKYKQYTSDLYEIRADKDSKGKTISGSAKEKKIAYINGLDIDYGARLILFKDAYPADDTYNMQIIEYLNGRDDFSYEDRVTILKELGFTVTADGTAKWD